MSKTKTKYNKYIFPVIFVLFVLCISCVLLNYNSIYKYFINIEKFNSTSDSSHIYTLSVLAIVKNEGMVLDELFQHHIWQGVEHFYMIDNDSTDNTKQIIQKYVDQGIASYYYRPEKAIQTTHYNYIYDNYARKESKWIAVIDADEFMYNRQKGLNMKDYVLQLNYKEVGGARLQFKMFGSSDYIKQPKNVRKSFIWRQKYVPTDVCCPWKVIVNTDATESLNVHDHEHTLPIVKEYDKVVINHYQIMSKEYFEKIKMQRGCVHITCGPTDLDWNYFNARDYKEEQDYELLELMN
jgi:glycosyltransferase involved in cell wall biosynthesis